MKEMLELRIMKKALVIENWINNIITGNEAAVELGISYRQVSRLKKTYLSLGTKGLDHKNKNKAPVNKTDLKIKQKVIDVFWDWKNKTDDGLNAAHLADVLLRDHNIKISRQTSWRILKSNGLQIKTRRVRKYRKRRERRDQMGDILYLDGSLHRWYGNSYPKSTLILCTDDATSGALWAIFVDEENRNACFEVAYEVMTRFGIPMSFWLDRASQFITTRGAGQVYKQTELPTHWQNAMYNLGVRNIFAHSPQARGRGERANGTFQDRLCSELQYRGISDNKTATTFVNEVFIPSYNKKFAVEPRSETAAWRVPPQHVDLRKILCARTDRRVHNDNTVKHNGRRFQILKKKLERSWAGINIEVQEWYDGTIHLVSKGLTEIPFQEIPTTPRYKKIEGIKINTLISDIHRSTYF